MTQKISSIHLPDGRTLSYAEYGSGDGRPVIYFHGSPGSHMDWPLGDPGGMLTAARGLRVIAPDRPGFGASTFQPGRRIADWPADVRALADALALDRFDSIAVSGGGPYGLVAAHALPDRMGRLAVVSGVGPLTPDLTVGMGPGKAIFRLSRRLPFLVNVQYALMKRGLESDPERLMRQVIASVSEPDRAMLAAPPGREAFLGTLAAALEQGPRGVTHDGGLLACAWEIPLAGIRIPVDFWHGAEDRNAPVAMARYLAERVPSAALHVLPGEGHFSTVARHMPTILDRLTA